MIDVNLNSKTPSNPAGTAHGFEPHVEKHGSDYRVVVTHQEPMLYSDGMYTKLVHRVIWATEEEARDFISLCLAPAGRCCARRGLVLPELDLRHWAEGTRGGDLATAAERRALEQRARYYNDKRNRD